MSLHEAYATRGQCLTPTSEYRRQSSSLKISAPAIPSVPPYPSPTLSYVLISSLTSQSSGELLTPELGKAID